MTEKKEHWATKKKRELAEQGLSQHRGNTFKHENLTESGEIDVVKAPPVKAQKTSWTVVWNERGVDREFTYYIETPEAEVNAAKLALKKGGKVI